MTSGKNIPHNLVFLGVALLQLIMTQVMTLLLSFFIPNAESFGQTHAAIFAFFLGITFTTGVFLAGWLAIKLHWLEAKPLYLARLVGALIGAYLPLIIALIVYRTLEPGNPFFLISMLACILGFYIPSWIDRN